jgi:photosystem II stability/assembly factor-like uncharacterized protein
VLREALKDDAGKQERDGISPADRAAGMLALVSDAKNSARRWRVFKFGRIETTTDGGGTWRDAMPPVGITFSAAASPAPGVCWVVGTKGGVWHLEAQSWHARAVPTDEDLVGVTAASAQQAVVATRSGQRFATSDGGKSWTRQ